MKKTLTLTALITCLLAVGALAQKAADSAYVTQGGATFRIGQQVRLGLGTGTDGTFRYVVRIDHVGFPTKEGLPASWATRTVTIARIKRSKATFFAKEATVYLVFRSDAQLLESFGINVEPALLAKEIQPN